MASRNLSPTLSARGSRFRHGATFSSRQAAGRPGAAGVPPAPADRLVGRHAAGRRDHLCRPAHRRPDQLRPRRRERRRPGDTRAEGRRSNAHVGAPGRGRDACSVAARPSQGQVLMAGRRQVQGVRHQGPPGRVRRGMRRFGRPGKRRMLGQGRLAPTRPGPPDGTPDDRPPGASVVWSVRMVRSFRSVVRGNPVRVRDCPAAVSGNDRRHHALGPAAWEATASRTPP